MDLFLVELIELLKKHDAKFVTTDPNLAVRINNKIIKIC